MRKRIPIISFLFLFCCITTVWSQRPVPTTITWELATPQYPTPDAFVYAFNVKEMGAKGDGITDDTEAFQTALNKLKLINNVATRFGGTVFVPSGKYVIKGNLTIPKGVTLRGEWKKPVKGEPIEGTILMAYNGRDDAAGTPLITLEPAAGFRDMAIWYPEQTADNIVPYPVSIRMGRNGIFGNNFCNVRNVTLVNSYFGIEIFDEQTAGCPVFYDIYGTPLSVGIEFDNIADVGRIDRVDFSPAYWSGSGLEGSPQIGGPHEQWIYENGTGIMMRRNDWSYTCYVSIEGYHTGFNAAPSTASPGSFPNGHNYELSFKNCKNAVKIDAISNAGILFSKIHIDDCDNGFVISPGVGATLHMMGCDISTNQNAITTDKEASTRVMMQSCEIKEGEININGGILSCTSCDFNNSSPQIHIGTNAQYIITGNRFKEACNIDNKSLFKGYIDHSPITVKPLPEFPQISHDTQKQKPERLTLYKAEMKNGVDPSGNSDCTSGLQKLLDQAAAEGGGIVFLPPGTYRFNGNLNIPSGVELKGAIDNSTTPVGGGSIIQVYNGKGDENGTPFITMQKNSGLRGVTINYPEQKSSLLPDNILKYPYTVQVQGEDVYIVNIAIRAAYKGFDLFTYKCDNHYIDYISGHSFNTGIRVGGGSENGKICNLQYNPICYTNGYESKFGSFPNSVKEYGDIAGNYCFDNFDWLVLGDCKNELLYNDFAFGGQRGVIFSQDNGKGPQGTSVGLGIDGARRSMYFGGMSPEGFELINTQVVAVAKGSSDLSNTKYLELSSDFTGGEATLFNSDYWGSAKQSILAENGTINLYNAWFQSPGENHFADLKGGTINIVNSNISTKNPLLTNGSEAHLSIQSSVVDPYNSNTDNCILWKNNLANTPELADVEMLDRSGWIASGSKNNGDAKNAIDGKDDTRWTSGPQKEPGDWFKIDMRSPQKFNTIILDTSKSPNDSPAKYELYVSNDDLTWGEPVASGVGGGTLTIINMPTQDARYFKIIQTGDTKTNYWSIYELKVIYNSTETGIETYTQNEGNVYCTNGNIHLKGFSGTSKISIYNLEGKKVYYVKTDTNYIKSGLTPGIYIIHIQNEEKQFRGKLNIQ